MLIGRIALRWLVARVALRRLLIAALALTFAGFLIYWGVSWPPAAIAGVFVIGLGIAPLYPLVTDFAIGAAPASVPGAGTSPPCASPSPSASRCCWRRSRSARSPTKPD